jgi:hypothetical protein
LTRIVQIDKNGEEFSGFVELETMYKGFRTHGEQVVYQTFEYMKKDYRSYTHFAGVIGKFDPYCFFLAKPILIKSVTRAALEQVWENVQKLE